MGAMSGRHRIRAGASRASVLLGGLLVLVTCVSGAAANTVDYIGDADAKPGQTDTGQLIVSLDLKGKKCPAGPECFNGAKVTNLSAVSVAFPNCPDILGTYFDLGNYSANVGKDRRFAFQGVHDSQGASRGTVSMHARFAKKGKGVRGSFTLDEDGCSSGEVDFNIPPDKHG